MRCASRHAAALARWPLLPAPHPACFFAEAPAGNSRWRTKYNLEPSALEAATAGARQTAALQDDAF